MTGEVYIFRALDISNVTVSISSLDYLGCSDVFIENSKTAFHSFTLNGSRVFNTAPSRNVCLLYSTLGVQKFSGRFGPCTKCPEIEVHEGRYRKSVLTPDTIFEYTQTNINYPLILVLRAKEDSNLFKFNVNVSTVSTLYPNDFKSSATFMNIIYNNTIIQYKNTGDVIAIVFTALTISCTIAILALVLCNEKHCCKHNKVAIQIGTHGMNTQYPITNGKNYKKYMDKFDLSSYVDDKKI